MTWLSCERFLLLFLNLPQSQGDCPDLDMPTQVSALVLLSLTSLTPPRTRQASSFPPVPDPSGRRKKIWAETQTLTQSLLCCPLKLSPLLSPYITKQKLDSSWLKAKTGFQLLSPSILNTISKFRFEKASQRELMKIMWLVKQSINFLSLY